MPRYSTRFFGTTSRSWSSAAVSLRPCVSMTPTTTSTPSARRSCAAWSIAYVLPTPGAAPAKILSRLRCSCDAACRSASGDGRRPCSSVRLTSRPSVCQTGGGRVQHASLEAPALAHAPERRRVDAETQRGFLERRRFREDALHVDALHVLQGVVDGGERRGGLSHAGGEHLIGEILRVDDVSATDDDGALERVDEFPDVAGPRVSVDRAPNGRRDRQVRASVAHGEGRQN